MKSSLERKKSIPPAETGFKKERQISKVKPADKILKCQNSENKPKEAKIGNQKNFLKSRKRISKGVSQKQNEEDLSENQKDNNESSSSDIEDKNHSRKFSQKILSAQISKTKAIGLKSSSNVKKTQNNSSKPNNKLSQPIAKFEDSEFLSEARPVTKNRFFEVLYYLLGITTFGFLFMLNVVLKDKIYRFFAFSKSYTFENATHAELKDQTNKKFHMPLTKRKIIVSNSPEFEGIVFEHCFSRYFFNPKFDIFQNVHKMAENTFLDILGKEQWQGRFEDEVEQLINSFGPNTLKFSFMSLFDELRAFLWQPSSLLVLSLILLLKNSGLTLFAFAFFLIFAAKFLFDLKEKANQQKRISQANPMSKKIMVLRRTRDQTTKKKIIESSELVLGDILELTNNLCLPADVLLLKGACVVKEGISLGKLQIRTKMAFENTNAFDASDERRTVSAGSEVVNTLTEVNEGCFGVIIRTRFRTRLGKELISGALSKFRSQSNSFGNLVLQFFALLGFIIVCLLIFHQRVILHKSEIGIEKRLEKILNFAIIICNPLVPFCFALAGLFSASRLIKGGIEINTKKSIAGASKIKAMLFERNTLCSGEKRTAGFALPKKTQNDSLEFESDLIRPQQLAKLLERDSNAQKFCEAFGLCTLTEKIGDDYFGSDSEAEMSKNSFFDPKVLSGGEKLTEKIYFPKLAFKEYLGNEYKIMKIISKQKNSSGELQRVLVQKNKQEFFAFSKFEAEKIDKICAHVSIPLNYKEKLDQFSAQGFKVIAFGFRQFSENEEYLESPPSNPELTFLGFYLLELESSFDFNDSIKLLKECDINLSVASNQSLYLTAGLCLKTGIIKREDELIVGKTENSGSSQKLVWLRCQPKIEFKRNCSQSFENEGDLSVIQEQINFVEFKADLGLDFLNTESKLGLTGKAMEFILNNLEEDLQSKLFAKCKFFSELNIENRSDAIFALQKANKGQIAYIFDRQYDQKAIKNADFSISVNSRSCQLRADFNLSNGSLQSLRQIVEEGKTLLINQRKIFFFIALFSCLCLFGITILETKGTSFGHNQLFFLSFIILLPFCLLQAGLKSKRLNAEINPEDFSWLKMSSKTSTMFLAGVFIVYFVDWVLGKTRFYRSPANIAKNSKAANANNSFFYDPFCVFHSTLFVILSFLLIENKRFFFKNRIFTTFDFGLYWLANVILGVYMLFIHKINPNVGLNEFLVKALSIPELFRFEFILLMFVPLIIFSMLFANLFGILIYKAIKKCLGISIQKNDEKDSIEKNSGEDSKIHKSLLKPTKQNSKRTKITKTIQINTEPHFAKKNSKKRIEKVQPVFPSEESKTGFRSNYRNTKVVKKGSLNEVK